MQYGFYFDNTRCTGCRTCALACRDYRDLALDQTYRRVIDYEGGSWEHRGDDTYVQNAYAYHVSLSCNHCNDPACVHVCPTGAMHKDDFGLVWPDWNKCIGCGYCTMACPYHAPVIDQVAKKSTKCDGCKERITQGKQTICVEACPLRALDFKEVTTLKTEHPGTGSDILPLADASYTSPNLFVRPSEAAHRAREVEGHIANPDELHYDGLNHD